MAEQTVSQVGKEECLRPTQVAHIVFKTSKGPAMVEFYLMLLNGWVAFENSTICFIRYDFEHHRVVVVHDDSAAPRDPSCAGLVHLAFTYPSLTSLLNNYKRLKNAGITPVWCINHGFTTSIYYRDPEGQLIETQFDNMTPDEAQAFMESPYFEINPIGVDFDPERLLEMLEAGVGEQELVAQRTAQPLSDEPPCRPEGIINYDWRGELLPA